MSKSSDQSKNLIGFANENNIKLAQDIEQLKNSKVGNFINKYIPGFASVAEAELQNLAKQQNNKAEKKMGEYRILPISSKP